ncbi:MAG TPA: hypothetical protein VGF60_15655 [Xanthobacteraceae bacterium]
MAVERVFAVRRRPASAHQMRAGAPRSGICRRIATGSASLLGLLSSIAASPAQPRAIDVAYVEATSGRATASLGETKSVLEPLDPIYDGTRLELAAGAEARICHYRQGRQITLQGPLQAVVSTGGITADRGAVDASGASCAAPAISVLPGGLPLRAAPRKISVALQPRIKVVNRSTQAPVSAVLWDRAHATAVARFDRGVAQPQLSEGKTYFLAVTLPGAATREIALEANAALGKSTLIVVLDNPDMSSPARSPVGRR